MPKNRLAPKERTYSRPRNNSSINHKTTSKVGSRYIGVARCSSKYKDKWYILNRWQAICAGKYLGSFLSPELAAKAYDKEAVKIWGLGNCRLNFPGEFKEYGKPLEQAKQDSNG